MLSVTQGFFAGQCLSRMHVAQGFHPLEAESEGHHYKLIIISVPGKLLVFAMFTLNNNNERISRALFHVKHTHLRRTGANTKIENACIKDTQKQ